MKLFALSIFHSPSPAGCTLVVSTTDLSSFAFYAKTRASEFITFLSRTIAECTGMSERLSVQQDAYAAHACRSGEHVAVLITDHEYPVRSAFMLLHTVVSSSTSESELVGHMRAYQDPQWADALARVQHEPDETRIVLPQPIEAVMRRGEQLDELVERAAALGAQSKMFYRTARQQNSCCIIG